MNNTNQSHCVYKLNKISLIAQEKKHFSFNKTTLKNADFSKEIEKITSKAYITPNSKLSKLSKDFKNFNFINNSISIKNLAKSRNNNIKIQESISSSFFGKVNKLKKLDLFSNNNNNFNQIEKSNFQKYLSITKNIKESPRFKEVIDVNYNKNLQKENKKLNISENNKNIKNLKMSFSLSGKNQIYLHSNSQEKFIIKKKEKKISINLIGESTDKDETTISFRNEFSSNNHQSEIKVNYNKVKNGEKKLISSGNLDEYKNSQANLLLKKFSSTKLIKNFKKDKEEKDKKLLNVILNTNNNNNNEKVSTRKLNLRKNIIKKVKENFNNFAYTNTNTKTNTNNKFKSGCLYKEKINRNVLKFVNSKNSNLNLRKSISFNIDKNDRSKEKRNFELDKLKLNVEDKVKNMENHFDFLSALIKDFENQTNMIKYKYNIIK